MRTPFLDGCICNILSLFLARSTGPTKHWLKKKKFGTYFIAQSEQKKFGPIPWQAVEIIGGLLATITEPQSHRHPRVLSIQVGKKFCA